MARRVEKGEEVGEPAEAIKKPQQLLWFFSED
ncbi:MAG: hypothetical protein K0Q68_2663 [Moraxellaceae bacterium]|jgi:hypothetical protein|nr:hypothetical protein [Moraxellaceae bacterium]